MVCTLLAGVNVVAFAADGATDTVPVSKFYNDTKKGGDGEHLFTKDQDEISWLASLPTWNSEGVAWTAPVSSSTSVWRCYNPNSGEHLYVDEGYADYLAGSGWNKEKVAFYSDDEMGVPVYRLWNGTDGVGSHHFTTDEGEVEWLVGQGWTAEDVAFFGVKEDVVEPAKLIDDDGLQADGTALVNDDLRVTFTPEIGVPYQITWYFNGTAIATETAQLNFTIKATKAGKYYATITNTKDQTFTTNSIEVVDKAAKAVITDFTVSEDYVGGVSENSGAKNVEYEPETGKLVATFTVNKQDYKGLFAIIPTEAVMTMDPDTIMANVKATGVAGKFTNPTSGLDVDLNTFTRETDKSKFTDDKVLATATSAGYTGKYYDNADGSRTYKMVMGWNHLTGGAGSASELTRGTNYTIGMIQYDYTDAEDVSTYVVGGMGDAPYVQAPVGITIAQVDDTNAYHVNAAKVALLEMGPLGPQPIAWLGEDVDGNKLPNGACGGTLTVYGSDDNKVSVDEYDDSAETNKAFKGGMVAMFNNANDNYFIAEFETDEGVYAEESLTFTSLVAEKAQEAVTTLTLKFNPLESKSLTAEPTAPGVFKADGTVTLYRNKLGTDDWSAVAEVTDEQLKKAEVIDTVEVEKGDDEAVFDDVVSKYYNDAEQNQYVAVYTPDDTSAYLSKKSTVTSVQQVATTFSLSGTTKNIKSQTGAGIEATTATLDTKDQFGNKMVTPEMGGGVAATGKTVFTGITGDSNDALMKVGVTNAQPGVIYLNMTPATSIAVGDYYTYKLSSGQTLMITCTKAGTWANHNAEFTISLV